MRQLVSAAATGCAVFHHELSVGGRVAVAMVGSVGAARSVVMSLTVWTLGCTFSSAAWLQQDKEVTPGLGGQQFPVRPRALQPGCAEQAASAESPAKEVGGAVAVCGVAKQFATWYLSLLTKVWKPTPRP